MLIAPLLLAAAAATATAGPAPPAPAAAASQAEPVLARIRAAYTKAASVQVTFVQHYAPAGFSDTAPGTGRLVLQAPASLRFEYDGVEGKVFTFDGTAARQYVAADKQMVVKRLTPAERARLPLLFLQEPRDVLIRFTVRATPAAGGLTELTLVPKAADEPKRVTLLADGSGEVKRLEILDGPGNRTTFTFTNREAGPKRPASDFALVPPRGTKVVSGEPGGGKE